MPDADFVVEQLHKWVPWIAVAIVAIIGLFPDAEDNAKSRLRAWLFRMMTGPYWKRCAMLTILAGWMVFEIYVAHKSYNDKKASESRDPVISQLLGEAKGLHASIHCALTNGQSSFALYQTFGPQVNDLVPRLYKVGQWSPELHGAYSAGSFDYIGSLQPWTNLLWVLTNTSTQLKNRK